MRLEKSAQLLIGVLSLAGVTGALALGFGVFKSINVQPRPRAPHFKTFDPDRFGTALGKVTNGGEPASIDGAAQEDYDNRAYPSALIAADQQLAAANAATSIGRLPGGKTANWQELGPRGVPADGQVSSESTGGTVATVFSGRATAIAISPACHANDCKIFVGAAGGGIWAAANALAPQPNWHPSSNGLTSNAIGSLLFDPTDPSGGTLYAGTGEPNGSGDSEAGVGLFKSTDFGRSWSLVPGSAASTAPCASGHGTCPVATGRSIAAIAVDPADSKHIFIGTAVARHGSSSVNGGRFTPPGAAIVGLYESTDGGASFAPSMLPTPQDAVNPSSPTGGDFFRGGASHIELYSASAETEVYASFFDYGVYRRSATLDGDSAFHRIFNSAGGGSLANSSNSRTEFSLAPNGANLRVYVGDTGNGITAGFYRVDNANVSAGTLDTGGTNGGWMRLSNSANGTPGFASFNYCVTQCTYDMPVYSPPGAPNIVYIGGAMQYPELFGRSNGRAIQRSEDAGVSFTDMTVDARGVSLHPDQHAIAATALDPNIVFIGNDGGLFRLNGSFTNVSSLCKSRPLSGNNLVDCTNWLSKVPTTISSLNQGLGTLQYQSLSVNVQNPLNDIMGGTQDNGTQAFTSKSNGNGNGNANWFVTIFGDGGQSGISASTPSTRFHTFFDAQIDMNFRGTDELGWNWVSDTFFSGAAAAEGRSFYIPIILDPTVAGTLFTGLQHVWRTQDDNGGQAFLESNCNEFFGTFTSPCGDWVAIGQDLSSPAFGSDKTPGSAGYIVAVQRAPSDHGTLWAGLRRGRVFVSSNADNPTPGAVTFYRIDSPSTPTRFVSGIAVDPGNPNHAFISFSGYNAYAAPSSTASGHVFDVNYDPSSHTATWRSLDFNLGDQPVTGIAFDPDTRDVFVSTDFGVNMLRSSDTQWVPAAGSLPPVAVYGLTIDSSARVLYAATHGRGAWKLDLR
ncbi:MAG TPA: hypothetical protein VGY48_11735 [Vicinamibacterales bacterium]|jgi:hypothetical protein|nr:hypothetical protein [Vicinamibacterales bacterium]